MKSELNGKCIIFSAPSGAGKTTIVHHLLSKDLGLEFSISACSRMPRANEVDGKDYYFMNVQEFKDRIDQNAFVEWEEVYTDHFYGTLHSEMQRIWGNGKVVIFDVDVVGGLNLKRAFGENALSVFVQPPSYEELEIRLRTRSTESDEKIAQRMEKADKELKFAKDFDVILVNDNLNDAFERAETLVKEFLNKE
jgi:guanylate kinase